MSQGPLPSEIKVNPGRDRMSITFWDGQSYVLDAEYLRVSSPSAEVRGHSPDQRITVAGKRDVRIADIVATGNYAIRIRFDDGHDTGIFTWSYLQDLGANHEARWQAHLAELAEKGLQR